MTVLQWHGAEITELPANATLLASSPDCRVQAFRVGPHAYGLQCHVEVGADMVDEWAAIPAYAESLRRTLGDDGLAHLQRDVREAAKRLPHRCPNAVPQPAAAGHELGTALRAVRGREPKVRFALTPTFVQRDPLERGRPALELSSLPGFITPLGSNTRLRPRISATSSAERL